MRLKRAMRYVGSAVKISGSSEIGAVIEKDVEAHLHWRVAMLGGMTVKVKAIGRRGFPDRAVFLPNGVLWLIELKAPKGRLSEHQKLFADDMRRLKQPYACFWTIEQIDAWAQNFKVFAL